MKILGDSSHSGNIKKEFLVIVLTVLISQIYADEGESTCIDSTAIIDIDTEEYSIITSPNFPDPYPCGNKKYYIRQNDTTGVEFIVKSLSLSGSDNDFLRVTLENEGYKHSILFTWYISNERKYRLSHDGLLTFEFEANSDEEYPGFLIEIKSLKEITTTTEPPTTEYIDVVDPMENHTLLIDVINFETVDHMLFKNTTACKGRQYCYDKKEYFEEKYNRTVDCEIGEENVTIHRINRCPLTWPNHDSCFSVVYSIPLFYDSENYTYELSTDSLESMWNTPNGNNCSFHNHFSLLDAPSSKHAVIIWIGVTICIIILIIIAFFLNWKCDFYGNTWRDEYTQYNDIDEVKKNDGLMFPTPHQTVPPLYGLEFYSPDENFWDADFPPRYSNDEMFNTHDNMGYLKDEVAKEVNLQNEFDSEEEIHMSLPNYTKVPINLRSTTGGDTVESYESNL